MTRNEFYQKIEEWILNPKEKWNHMTLMAYFYHKYKIRTGTNFYPATWNGNPALTKESRDFSKLFKLFAVDNYKNISQARKAEEKKGVNQKIYNYINWMFDYKFRYGRKAVTGTGIFLNNNMLNEFEVMYNSHIQKAQEKDGIGSLIKWAEENAPNVLSNHQLERIEDLAMIEKYIGMYSLKDDSDEYKLISRAKEVSLI